MAKRSKPEIVSARVTIREKAELELLATAEGKTVSQLIWELTVPSCRERLLAGLTREARASDHPDPQPGTVGLAGPAELLDQRR